MLVHLYRHRSIGIESEQAVQGLLLAAAAAAGDLGGSAATGDFVGGFADGHVGDLQFGATAQGRIYIAQVAGEVAFQFIRTVHNISCFLGAQSGKNQVARRDIAAVPVGAAERAVAGNAYRCALWNAQVAAGHQPVHIKGVVVRGPDGNLTFVQGRIARHITTIEVGINDLCHVDGGRREAGGFGGNGGFQDFGCFRVVQQGENFFS